ncbi:MAG TPA: glycoside hydrolase domain-containing protein, partial [Gemmatimonadales bacterium]|nr:glycoside hydrolase domain-containing protein [Gemmatimonadales bacterium]
WRRRDRHPELKRVEVIDATGRRVTDAWVPRLDRESGDVVFAAASAGDYDIYYMPYQGTFRSNYPKITYRKPDTTASGEWRVAGGVDSAGLLAEKWRALPQATVAEFDDVDSLASVYPMEVIATAAETDALRRAHPDAAYLLFPEDRTRPIKMRHSLPERWTSGAGGAVTGTADRGEFYAFQVGVWALRPVGGVTVRFSGLTGPGGGRIPASAFQSFNTGGVDWQGRPFARTLSVDSGAVQALWCGVMVPDSAAAGAYDGTVTVTAAGVATTLPIHLTVTSALIPDHGDDEPWRLARLRWLNSTLDLDTTLVPPYTPVSVKGTTLSILGRTVALAPSGFPRQVTSWFTPEMTAIGRKPRGLLAEPVALTVVDSGGREVRWAHGPVRFVRRMPGAAVWEVRSSAGAVSATTHAQMEFDGNIDYTVALTASHPTPLADVRLDVPYRRSVAKYFMGMGEKGGLTPDSYDWAWDVKKNQDAVWIGDVNAGMQVTLSDQHYIRPLNTNFYQLRPLVMPESWDNGGKGRCHFGGDGPVAYRMRCTSGARMLAPGDTLYFNVRLLVTPFHPIDPKAQFSTRFYHAYVPVTQVADSGANVVNVHHATDINPFINYPFLRPREMRAYADSAHAIGIRFKIYYTVRELTNHAPEIWALRSLGNEVLADGPGGGHSWLQEHLVDHYITGWVVPERRDVAVVTSGISRWHNFYVEGLDWLVKHEQIDGIYLDDVAFDRTTMQRIRRVLARGRPHPMIDLHSANQYDKNDGYASSANLYLEHFPYIDRLWFGEYFDYNSQPDYWLTEISGIPFGLMGEMLQDGGNPWRGMVFGMTDRLPWAGDPRPLWLAWDAFGITDARMLGWWAPSDPVKTGRSDILATSYVRKGRTMVAVASWAKDTVALHLSIDWKALGLDPRTATISAPAIEKFQPAAMFKVGDPIPMVPGKGWLLVIK